MRINILEEVNEPETIDENIKEKILQESHDTVLGEHRGMNKTYEAIRKHYRWPNTRSEIEDYVKRCARYRLNKTLRPHERAQMEITTAKQPFQR
jgi:hypothetical protein